MKTTAQLARRTARSPLARTRRPRTFRTRGMLPWRSDTGATTAEYAITTLAACGFAAILVILMKSETVRDLVQKVISTALGMGQ